jgi:hypothetical protein
LFFFIFAILLVCNNSYFAVTSPRGIDNPAMASSSSAGAVHKVIMVGSGGVGKSALTLQFMYDEVSHICRFCFNCFSVCQRI